MMPGRPAMCAQRTITTQTDVPMTSDGRDAAPVRGKQHEALAAFLGDWRAEGKSYGGPSQTVDDPKGAPFPWTSTHTAKWHTGEFFLIQDERAMSGGPFDTLSVMGVDPTSGRYFAQSFENHGFSRRYDVAVDGRDWTFNGEQERSRIAFSPDGKTQTIVWEWHSQGRWLPLCDRVAHREA
jgi:hypothetical protein